MIGSNVLNRIQSVLQELPESEQKIGEFILEKPELVINMSSKELASAVHTSTASISRFCKSIAVNNFSDLKINISAEITRETQLDYSDVEPGESLDGIKLKLLGNAVHSMTETVEQLNNQQLEQAITEITNASVIYLFGVGASYLVADNAKQKWARLGKIVLIEQDIHQFIGLLASAPPKALVWLISNSGKTREVLHLANIAKQHQLKVLALTQFGKNPLTDLADLTLHTSKPREIDWRSAATSSLHSQFMVVDILLYHYISQNFDEASRLIHHSKQSIHQFEQLN